MMTWGSGSMGPSFGPDMGCTQQQEHQSTQEFSDEQIPHVERSVHGPPDQGASPAAEQQHNMVVFVITFFTSMNYA